MGFTSETGSEAGKKSKKEGPNKKTVLWEALGEKFTGEYADTVMEYLDTLIHGKTIKKDGKEDNTPPDLEAFMSEYKDLLNYFKPKQSAITSKNEHTYTGPAKIEFGDTSKKDEAK